MDDTGFVGPFAGLVVRAEDAARLVVAMPASGDTTREPFDPAAYDAPAPALYRYRQRTATGVHTGLVCTMTVAALADGRVRGHEAVDAERVAALVDHLAAEPGRVELVTTLHDAGPLFRAALRPDGTPPLVDTGTEDGVRHAVWRVEPARDLLRELSGVRHYVADGHHRVAASTELWRRAGRPASASIAVVAHALDGLSLEAHRRPPGEEVAAPTLAEVLATADAGRTVAPKTTWFRPKPASGLFVGP